VSVDQDVELKHKRVPQRRTTTAKPRDSEADWEADSEADSDEVADYIAAFKQAFSGPEHQPFLWTCGEPGALLIHGFVGTPAEVRPLGQVLCNAGWTVHAPLLPGFGSDIDTLFERDSEAWLDACRHALLEISRDHAPVLLVGYSMGASLALKIAAEPAPDGVILISPFWRLPFESAWLRLLSRLLQIFVREVRPFKDLDFDDESVRDGIHEVMPDLDLHDPEIRSRIRQMSVPTRIIGELGRLGKAAFRAAPNVSAPFLVIQGLRDEIVPPPNTRRLLPQLRDLRGYHEIPGAHDLVRVALPAWETVADLVRQFAADITRRQRQGRAR
jgi:carboxylesterase